MGSDASHFISYLESLVRLLICCYSGSIRNSLTIAFSLEAGKKKQRFEEFVIEST